MCAAIKQVRYFADEQVREWLAMHTRTPFVSATRKGFREYGASLSITMRV
jgi:hypothetical protein